MTPPHTNRGVTHPELTHHALPIVSIDWLQYSVPWPDNLHRWPDHGFAENEVIREVLPPHEKLFMTGEILHPIRGYNAGQAASFGRVFWHSGNRAQHIGVIFTGDDMRAAVNILMPNMQMLNWAIAKGKKIARMDVAVDIFDSRADPSDILKMWQLGHVGTPARKVTETTSYTDTRDRGIIKCPTIYIGSRVGDRMLRVYDKGKQTASHDHWVRAELQTRDDNAMGLAKAIQRGGITDTGRQAIRAFCSCPRLGWWVKALEGPAVELEKVGRKETNTEKWVMNVALPAVQKLATEEMQDGVTTTYDAVSRVFNELQIYHNRRTQ